jgi:hypothetical protein
MFEKCQLHRPGRLNVVFDEQQANRFLRQSASVGNW